MPVGGTQQFTASGAPSGTTVNWSVTGGCGAITSAGLFAATATNSATQPCNVVATAGGLTGTAPVTVFGPASSIACSANPTSVVANGSNTVVFTFTLKDANGNTVGNASSPAITVNNDTPTLITLTGGNNQTITPSSGVASVTGTVSQSTGNIQVSASATGLTGCNVIIPVDHDEKGIELAERARGIITPFAKSIRVVPTAELWKHLPESARGISEHDDVSDWLSAGGDPSKLLDICKAIPAEGVIVAEPYDPPAERSVA